MPEVPFAVRALYEYQAEQDDDLPLVTGQKVTVDEVLDADWYHGYYTDASGKQVDGIFPINYVAVDVIPPARPSRGPTHIEATATNATEPPTKTASTPNPTPAPVPAPVPAPDTPNANDTHTESTKKERDVLHSSPPAPAPLPTPTASSSFPAAHAPASSTERSYPKTPAQLNTSDDDWGEEDDAEEEEKTISLAPPKSTAPPEVTAELAAEGNAGQRNVEPNATHDESNHSSKKIETEPQPVFELKPQQEQKVEPTQEDFEKPGPPINEDRRNTTESHRSSISVDPVTKDSPDESKKGVSSDLDKQVSANSAASANPAGNKAADVPANSATSQVVSADKDTGLSQSVDTSHGTASIDNSEDPKVSESDSTDKTTRPQTSDAPHSTSKIDTDKEPDFKTRLARFNQGATEEERPKPAPKRTGTFRNFQPQESEDESSVTHPGREEVVKPSMSFKERIAMLQQNQQEEQEAAEAAAAAEERRKQRRAEAEASRRERAEIEAREKAEAEAEAKERAAQEAAKQAELEKHAAELKLNEKPEVPQIPRTANALQETEEPQEKESTHRLAPAPPVAHPNLSDDGKSLNVASDTTTSNEAEDAHHGSAVASKLPTGFGFGQPMPNAESSDHETREDEETEERGEKDDNEDDNDEAEARRMALRQRMARLANSSGGMNLGMIMGGGFGAPGGGGVPKSERRRSLHYESMSPAEIEAAEARREAEESAPVSLMPGASGGPPSSNPTEKEHGTEVPKDEGVSESNQKSSVPTESETSLAQSLPSEVPTKPLEGSPEPHSEYLSQSPVTPSAPTPTHASAQAQPQKSPASDKFHDANETHEGESISESAYDGDSEATDTTATPSGTPATQSPRPAHASIHPPQPPQPPRPAEPAEPPRTSRLPRDDTRASASVSGLSEISGYESDEDTDRPLDHRRVPEELEPVSSVRSVPPLPQSTPTTIPGTNESKSSESHVSSTSRDPVPPSHAAAHRVPPTPPSAIRNREPVATAPPQAPPRPPVPPPQDVPATSPTGSAITSAPVPPVDNLRAAAPRTQPAFPAHTTRAPPPPPGAPLAPEVPPPPSGGAPTAPPPPPEVPLATPPPPTATHAVPPRPPGGPRTAPPPPPPVAHPAQPPPTPVAHPAPPQPPHAHPASSGPSSPGVTPLPQDYTSVRRSSAEFDFSEPELRPTPQRPPPAAPVARPSAPAPSVATGEVDGLKRASTFGAPPPPHAPPPPQTVPPHAAPPHVVSRPSTFNEQPTSSPPHPVPVGSAPAVVPAGRSSRDLGRQGSRYDRGVHNSRLLKEISARLGPQVLSAAHKHFPAGSEVAIARRFVSGLTSAVLPEDALGVEIYSNFGNASVQQVDEIRPGDICVFEDATFQGSKGPLQKYTKTYQDAAFVVETWDGTKKKLHFVDTKREALRVTDLRMGVVRIFRVVDNQYFEQSEE